MKFLGTSKEAACQVKEKMWGCVEYGWSNLHQTMGMYQLMRICPLSFKSTWTPFPLSKGMKTYKWNSLDVLKWNKWCYETADVYEHFLSSEELQTYCLHLTWLYKYVLVEFFSKPDALKYFSCPSPTSLLWTMLTSGLLQLFMFTWNYVFAVSFIIVWLHCLSSDRRDVLIGTNISYGSRTSKIHSCFFPHTLLPAGEKGIVVVVCLCLTTNACSHILRFINLFIVITCSFLLGSISFLEKGMR